MSWKDFEERRRSFRCPLSAGELLKKGIPSREVEAMIRATYPKPTQEELYDCYLTGNHTPKGPELLYISPDMLFDPTKDPVKDDLTDKIDFILDKAYKGEGDAQKRGFLKNVGWDHHQYYGMHTTSCGMTSEPEDWYIPTKEGVWTNSLAGYYVKHYRNYIPQVEIEKIEAIYKELKEIESLVRSTK